MSFKQFTTDGYITMKRILTIALLGSLVAMPNAMAEISDQDFKKMREELAAMSQRLDQLAAENAELRRAQVEESAEIVPAEAWPDRITLNGDFRYRYETIDVEGSSKRRRNRIRARTNIEAKVADNIDVGFGLATGGDDPVSTNQDIGGGGSSKNVVLNLAYVDWEAIDGLHLYAGKFKNPLTRVGGQSLMWDADWTPEGLAMQYNRDWFFVNAFGSFLQSDNKDNNETLAWGGQFGATGTVGAARLTGGIGYYSIEAEGKSTTFGDQSDPNDFFGNSAVEAGGFACGTNSGTQCIFLYDYLLTEVFAEASFELDGWPVSVFADYVNNSEASDNNTGWTIGTRIGQTKDRGQMQFTYMYVIKEADSLLGLATDSDFGGGGTNTKGHWLQFYYGVSKNWTIGAQYFINEVGLNTDSKSDFDRLMIDMQWKWR